MSGGASLEFSPEMAFSSYSARFGTGFEPGERAGERGAHQGLVDGGEVVEMTCTEEGRTGGWTLAGEGVAASICCF
jgi:hypothetical protein